MKLSKTEKTLLGWLEGRRKVCKRKYDYSWCLEQILILRQIKRQKLRFIYAVKDGLIKYDDVKKDIGLEFYQ